MNVNWLDLAASPSCFQSAKAWFDDQKEPSCVGYGLSTTAGTLLDAAVHAIGAAVILGTGLFIPATIIAAFEVENLYANRFGQVCNLSQGLKHLIAAIYSIVLIPFRLLAGNCCLNPNKPSEGKIYLDKTATPTAEERRNATGIRQVFIFDDLEQLSSYKNPS